MKLKNKDKNTTSVNDNVNSKNKRPKTNALERYLWSRRESNSRPNKQFKCFLHA